jgi:hypothetical protein
MPSIMKNHKQHEEHFFTFAHSLSNMETLSLIGKYQPQEVSLTAGLVKHLHGIHVDHCHVTNETTMYDVANSSLLELRGSNRPHCLKKKELNAVLLYALPYVHEDTLLSWLDDAFKQFQVDYPRLYPRLYKDDILSFIRNTLANDVTMGEMQFKFDVLPNPLRKQFEEDLIELRKLVNEEYFEIEYVYTCICLQIHVYIHNFYNFFILYFMYSLRTEALIQSVPFTARAAASMPALNEMALNPRASRCKIPFVGWKEQTTTTFWGNKKKVNDDLKYSFGRPHYFFRFSFTSAIDNIPMACVVWENFIIESRTRTNFLGHFRREAWEQRADISNLPTPFVNIEFLLPSRFILAYTDTLEVGFL